MTDTNTVIEIETKLMNELSVLKDKNVGKERKKEARTKIKRYEKFLNDIDYKKINGKKYPKRVKPVNTPKEELYKLIDDVETPHDLGIELNTIDPYNTQELDISGVSVGKTRFEFTE
jgi:hypothetical protein